MSGGAGMLLGPVWAALGAFAGAIVVPLTLVFLMALRIPDPEKLLAAGKPGEALQIANAQLAGDRRLAARWPGRFREPVAWQLLTNAEILQALHKEPQALDAADEAVEILTELAERGPARLSIPLARGHCLQSGLLTIMGRHGEALGAAEAAVALYRKLAIADRNGYVGRLAGALERQADALGYLDRVGGARAAAAEAALIRSDMMPGTPPAARLSDGVQP